MPGRISDESEVPGSRAKFWFRELSSRVPGRGLKAGAWPGGSLKSSIVARRLS